MKRTFRIMPLVAALMMMASCTADNDVGGQTGAEGLVPLCITSSIVTENAQGGAATRAATGLLSTQFASGEPFQVYFSNGSVATSTGAETNFVFTADGSGGVSSVSPSQPFFTRAATSTTISGYHGKSGGTSGTAVTNATTSFSVAADQTTDAAYKASDLMYATATVIRQYPSTAVALQFAHKMSKIIVNATPSTGITITQIRIVNGYRTINIANPTTTTSGSYLGSTLSDAISTGQPVYLYNDNNGYSNTLAALSGAALIPPQTIDGSFLQVVTNTGTATYAIASKAFESGQSYTYNISLTATSIGVTTQITDWDSQGSTQLINFGSDAAYVASPPAGVVAVDLGLPSGTKWANMNIGATSATDRGLYFAWGDIIGRGGEIVPGTDFPADGYFYTETFHDGEDYTKYNNTDGKTVLEPCDDAAYIHWGVEWRMPTKEEFDELINDSYTTNSRTTQGGVPGFLITSKSNGNSIFLPAAGTRGDYVNFDSNPENRTGMYRSSSRVTGDLSKTWVLQLGPFWIRTFDYISRSHGCTIRPVLNN